MTKKCASCDPYERAFVFSPTQATWLGHTSDFIENFIWGVYTENFGSVSDSTSDVVSELSGILQDCLFDR